VLLAAAILLLHLAPPVDAPVSARVHPTQDTIVVDGRLDEPAWARAPEHALERQKVPHYGAAVSLPTRWRALIHERSLYLAIRCEVTAEVPMIARRTRRDRPVESDRVTIDIDSRGQGIDAFHFEVTAGGSIVDGIRYNDTKIDLLWDAIWWAEVVTDAGGYTVEIEIPLEILRRPEDATAPVGIQIRRYITARGETDEWAATPRDGSQEVSRYGRLAGLVLPKRRLTVDLLPYLGFGPRIETGTGAPPGVIARGGADLKLRLGSDLTLDTTALPDFGNVEADTAVLNLTTLEVRFPEKRPFFLEGFDVLETPLGVFYTRRIGSLAGTTAGTALRQPLPARVLTASKLVARLNSRWSLAALAAVTQFQDTLVRDNEAGLTAPRRVLPTYLYGVLRARYALPHAGFLGVMVTSRTGFDRGPGAPWTTCPDGHAPVRGTCFADSYVVSADARVRSRTGMWVGTAQVLGTFRVGGTPEVGLDGNELAAGDKGGAALGMVEKTGGRVIGALRYEWDGRDADWNAVGFLPQPNRHAGRLDLAFQTLRPHGPVLEDRWQLEVFERFTLAGLPNGSGYQFNYRARWRSFWRSFTEVHLRPSYFDIRELRDGTPVQRAGLVGLEQEFTSDSRKPVIADMVGLWQQRRGSYRLDGELNVDVNIREALQLRVGLSGTLDRGEVRWVETDLDAGVFRLGRLDARALGVLFRVNYTITARLELQAYAQIFGVGTRYGDRYTAPVDASRVLLGALQPDSLAPAVRETEALVAANIFLRWEYTRGSNLWLVFSRNQLDELDPTGTGRISFHRLGALPAAYLIMAKATVLIGHRGQLRRARARRASP